MSIFYSPYLISSTSLWRVEGRSGLTKLVHDLSLECRVDTILGTSESTTARSKALSMIRIPSSLVHPHLKEG